MSRKEATSWIVYWIGIAFILTCLTQALMVGAQEDPCQWEIDNAKSVCRAMGRKSPECAQAIDKIDMCRSEGSDDPLEGLQRCETVCHTDSMGRVRCTTKCYDRTGRRV